MMCIINQMDLNIFVQYLYFVVHVNLDIYKQR
jgi:hypothetical protein